MNEATDVRTSWTTARLTSTSESGYVFIGATSGSWGPFPMALPSARRRTLLHAFRQVADRLLQVSAVSRADVFRAVLRPPGDRRTTERSGTRARFDVVLLVEASSLQTASDVAGGTLIADLRRALPDHLFFVGSNVRRIGPVDHDTPGVFLFNYFSAPSSEVNLHAWQYTAGWFQDETGLDNSTVLQPRTGEDARYTLVNHCRWDRYADVLPALIFKRSFRSFVLRVFAEHDVTPHPILYSLFR